MNLCLFLNIICIVLGCENMIFIEIVNRKYIWNFILNYLDK